MPRTWFVAARAVWRAPTQAASGEHSLPCLALRCCVHPPQDLGDAAAPSDLKVNFGAEMLKALLGGWAEQRRRRGQQQQQQQQRPRQQQQQQEQGAAADDRDSSAAANSVGDGGGGGEAGGGDVDMPDTEGDAGRAAGGGGSSRFSFQGALPPVVLVSGGGPSAALPWRCAIDSFTGNEDVPQVGS